MLTLSVALPIEAYRSGDSVERFVHALDDRLRAISGAVAASVSTDLPLESNERRVMTPDGLAEDVVPPSVAVTWTAGDYFRTLGVPLRGRFFSSTEQSERRAVAIVSQSFAARYWPGEEPLGKRIKNGMPASRGLWLEVVGVAGDAPDGPLTNEPRVHVYRPFNHLSPELDFIATTGSSWVRTLRLALLAHGGRAHRAGPRASRRARSLTPGHSHRDHAAAGWLVEHKTTPEEVRELFAVAERDLKDSAVAGISSDTQLGLAYNAALQLCTAALAAAGYRASRERKHYLTLRRPPTRSGRMRRWSPAWMRFGRSETSAITNASA